jgi:hypothetical protein
MQHAALGLVVLIASFGASVARAAPVQGVTFDSVGNTNSSEFITGWQFNTALPITLTHLGHVDMQNNSVPGDADVGIWNVSTGGLLASTTVTSTSPTESSGVGSTLYEPITPLPLAPGDYIIAAQRNGENFYFDNPHTTAAGINWVAGKAAPIGPLPASTSAFTITRHDAGSYFGANFKFESDGGGGGGDSLILSHPTGRAVLQRSDRNLADVTIEGTYPVDTTRIEARAVPRTGFAGTATGWQVIDAAPKGGTFSSSLSVRGGWYDIEVKAFDEMGRLDSASVERVGVGEVFITAGQSNSANHGSPQQQPDDDRVSARTTIGGNTWQVANDPQPTATGSGGSPWPELGDLLAEEYDVPVGLLSVGVGATRVDQWLPGSSHYQNRLRPAIESLGSDGFRAILWHQGESDSLAGTSADVYASRLNSTIDQSRTDAGFDVPWGVALASFHPSSGAAAEAEVVQGEQQVIADDPLVFEGPLTDDFHFNGWLSDSVHFNQTGLDMHSLRWFEQIQAAGIIDVSNSLLADLTNNGFVDFQDLTILLANWNKEVTAAEGNLVSADTTPVNFQDLTVLLADWTGPGPAGSPEAALGTEAVPEPSSLLLALFATLGLSFGWRRR